MITIYTRTNNLFTLEFCRWAVKKLLGRYSGPDAVLDSLKRGLEVIGINYEINPLKPTYKIIHVLSGVQALKSILKSKSPRSMILAGPALVTSPLEQSRILSSDKIDAILVPSKWVQNFYTSALPQIGSKTFVWPAGVKIPREKSTKDGPIIVYRKNIPDHIYVMVVSELEKQNLKFVTLRYGKFSHKKYIEHLRRAPLLIYLQLSESQGIALNEAWSYDVPSLVHKNTKWLYKNWKWEDEHLSAPYLNDYVGSFFNENNFSEKLTFMLSTKFEAKKYCESEFSDRVSTNILLDIIKDHEKSH